MAAPTRFPLLASGIFGVTGVALGALGAHALESFLADRGMAHAWDTAARYQMFHAVALFTVAAWVRGASGAAASRLIWAARLWSVGVLFFSGSLYGLAVGAPRWFGPLTPLGGMALITGWCCVIAAAFAKEA